MKKLLALLLAVVMVLSLAACGNDDNDKDNKSEGSQKNTYETPVELTVKRSNEKDASKMLDAEIAVLNGLCESQYKELVKILQKSEDYDEEEIEAAFKRLIDIQKDEYGSNYKFSYKIEEKEELDKDDLKDTKDSIKDSAMNLKFIIDEMRGFDSDDLEDLADELGISKSDAEAVLGILDEVYKELNGFEIAEGYKLTVNYTIKGSNLEEPEEFDGAVYVYKINGRWVSDEALGILSSFGDLF